MDLEVQAEAALAQAGPQAARWAEGQELVVPALAVQAEVEVGRVPEGRQAAAAQAEVAQQLEERARQAVEAQNLVDQVEVGRVPAAQIEAQVEAQ